ncbi:MAG: DNA mismatch repair endonuclease MutL [Waddliaceae bacterium]
MSVNMPSKIRILDEHTINQIKAGEVIENPASVVKELVENSLDAGSTEIIIEIRAGGRQLIRITDNGSGMGEDDALLSFEKHATSKLHALDDLHMIDTMGFRGEAVPSIASCSKVTLLTSEGGQGTRIYVEGGKIKQCTDVTCAKGTTFEVAALFYNTPVRKKFQRSPSQDSADIHKMLVGLALGNPQVAFRFIRDEKQVFSLNPSSLKERIRETLGEEFTKDLLPIKKEGDICISGWIGEPTASRHNRLGQYLFFNRRRIYSPLVSRAVIDGYGPTLPHSRHPIFILHITLPGDLIDANVHPQKREVRLREESRLKQSLFDAVDNALRGTEKEMPIPIPSFRETPSFAPLPRQNMYVKEKEEEYKWTFTKEEPEPSRANFIESIPGYVLLKNASNQLIILDQRAAHARVLYEQLGNTKQTEKLSQALLIPETLKFTTEESQLLTSHLELIKKIGVEIDEFGKETFIIRALPPIQGETNLKQWLLSLVENPSKPQDKLKRLAFLAAISSTRKLFNEEALLLYKQLISCDHPRLCPRGNKTWVVFSPETIGYLFEKGATS